MTFEGPEGSGKSTLIRLVEKELVALHIPNQITREPGGTTLAEKVRDWVLQSEVDPLSELLLYEAARAHHVTHLIQPALRQGKMVLCDRFTDSTLAYQGSARGISWTQIQTLNLIATQGIIPDVTFLLDLDPLIGLKRAQDPNRFEREGEDFHRKVYSGYHQAYAEAPERWHILSVQSRTPEEICRETLKVLEERFFHFFKGASFA